MEKLTTNPLVHADTTRDVVDITTNPLAEICNLVDKRNLGGEKCIGGIFGEFSCLERSNHKRSFDQVKRSIKILHDGDRFLIAAANNNAIRSHEVINRSTFPQ